MTTGFAIVDFRSQLLIMKGEICSSDVMKAIKRSVAGENPHMIKTNGTN